MLKILCNNLPCRAEQCCHSPKIQKPDFTQKSSEKNQQKNQIRKTKIKVRKAKFTCQFCAITVKLEAALTEIGMLNEKIANLEAVQVVNKENEKKWSDLAKGVPADLKANQDKVQADWKS